MVVVFAIGIVVGLAAVPVVERMTSTQTATTPITAPQAETTTKTDSFNVWLAAQGITDPQWYQNPALRAVVTSRLAAAQAGVATHNMSDAVRAYLLTKVTTGGEPYPIQNPRLIDPSTPHSRAFSSGGAPDGSPPIVVTL